MLHSSHSHTVRSTSNETIITSSSSYLPAAAGIPVSKPHHSLTSRRSIGAPFRSIRDIAATATMVTDEEITDYLAKKAHKKALKVAKKLKFQTVSGYANHSNPSGDSNLNQKFVWRKKIEWDVSQGLPLGELSLAAQKKRQRERMAEIEKVKRRRDERAIEKAQLEEEMALLARERARAEFQDWEKKEEEFHFDQSKVRSEIRLREGRTKPIDILTKHLVPSDDFGVEP